MQVIKQRDDISLLRISATLAVIFLHTCNTLTSDFNRYNLSTSQTHFFTACHNIMNWGVPSFIMITGILMLKKDRELTIKAVLFKYCKRILIALFLFGTPFSMMEMIMTEKTLRVGMIWEGLLNVINGKSWGHLWYLYMLLGLYLTIPLLKVFTEHCSKEVLRYTIVTIGAFVWGLPIINLLGLNSAFELPIGTYILFYPLLGFYLDNYGIKALDRKWLDGILTICCFSIICVLSYTEWNGADSILNVLYLILTISAYGLIKGVEVKNSERLWIIDRLCFGVYLIHPFFINIAYKALHLTPAQFRPNLLAVILFWIVFSAISFAASWLMSLINPLKKYVL